MATGGKGDTPLSLDRQADPTLVCPESCELGSRLHNLKGTDGLRPKPCTLTTFNLAASAACAGWVLGVLLTRSLPVTLGGHSLLGNAESIASWARRRR